MMGEKIVIFALDPKLDWVIVTLVLTSAPKFLWYETEIVAENSYSGIWPFLEIQTLKTHNFWGLTLKQVKGLYTLCVYNHYEYPCMNGPSEWPTVLPTPIAQH